MIRMVLVFIALMGAGCAMDADEEQAPKPMANNVESTDWA